MHLGNKVWVYWYNKPCVGTVIHHDEIEELVHVQLDNGKTYIFKENHVFDTELAIRQYAHARLLKKQKHFITRTNNQLRKLEAQIKALEKS